MRTSKNIILVLLCIFYLQSCTLSPQHAIRNNDLDYVKNIQSSEVNLQILKMWTPLHYAIVQRKTVFVDILLDKGANPNTANQFGMNAFLAAVNTNQVEIAETLLESHGANVNHLNNKNVGAVELAVVQGNIEMLELLIKHNVDVNTVNVKNASPIALAVSKSNDKMLGMLIDAGGDVNRVGNNPTAMLINAAYGGNKEIVTLLINGGAKPNAANEYGRTALLAAVSMNQVEIVETLLESHGANVNHLNNKNVGAVELAVVQGNIEMLELLIKHNVDVNTVNVKNASPIALAVSKSNDKMLGMLIDAGGDVTYTNNNSAPLLTDAAYIGNKNLVVFFG
ncbi:ankyrin repeat domain-containing protein [Colwellia sp. MSW7]|uniref:Ankyrin repeat domain-containing protein n=1 Tax=Colwellia maritima TaxID=2912588 RepID=A0ABS9WYF9_9GAMM|nr:ankyrin repeat domain-containing protein [Colwellia maritima]MCI2283009.1 ankyrin repeat domain-containing protein [Colwellia maritima]